ncbi:hypothetical protein [Phenylobacterium sp.]|uniref:hypothetical protein n=1 Tax=Phenylobacterium sp. TaxID=1871053 RepID=UPI00286D4FF2|nr:hypothetical protein [Phenylobacterium sp.]
MKTILLSLTAAATLAAAAAPVAAQPWRGQDHAAYDQPQNLGDEQHRHDGADSRPAYGQDPRHTQGYDQPARIQPEDRQIMHRLYGLDWKVDNAARQHRISWRDGRDLRAALLAVKPAALRVQAGRADGSERQRVEQTMARVEATLNSYAQNDRHDGRR